MESFTPTKDGNSWIISPPGDGWVFERTYPSKWKANLALAIWLQGGRVSDYFAAARDEKAERSQRRVEKRSAPGSSGIAPSIGDLRVVPSLQELVSLNPRLAAKRPDEVHALVRTMRECGYQWDLSQKVFYHPDLSRSVRTQGLDVFTPAGFRQTHEAQLGMAVAHPEAFRLETEYKRLLSRVGGPVLRVSLLWGVFGWLLASWGTWLLVLGVLIGLFVVVQARAMSLAKKSGQIQRGGR